MGRPDISIRPDISGVVCCWRLLWVNTTTTITRNGWIFIDVASCRHRWFVSGRISIVIFLLLVLLLHQVLDHGLEVHQSVFGRCCRVVSPCGQQVVSTGVGLTTPHAAAARLAAVASQFGPAARITDQRWTRSFGHLCGRRSIDPEFPREASKVGHFVLSCAAWGLISNSSQ